MQFNFLKSDSKNVLKKKKPGRIVVNRIPKELIIAYCFAAISIVALLFVCIYSAMNKGGAGVLVGIIPLCSLVINIVGLILSYKSLKIDDVKLKHVYLGLILNGVLVLFYMVVYVMGFN